MSKRTIDKILSSDGRGDDHMLKGEAVDSAPRSDCLSWRMAVVRCNTPSLEGPLTGSHEWRTSGSFFRYANGSKGPVQGGCNKADGAGDNVVLRLGMVHQQRDTSSARRLTPATDVAGEI